jgi:hypothetical protein
MTAPVVTFDNAAWIAQFPDFAAVGATLGQSYFNRASLLCANDSCNPAYGLDGTGSMLGTLLYLLTSHIAWLNAPRDANGNPAASGQPASPIVGRIDQASEGSVSVHADMGEANAGSPSQAWYMQTKWGSEYWASTAGIRTGRYVGRPTIVPGPAYFGRGIGFRG